MELKKNLKHFFPLQYLALLCSYLLTNPVITSSALYLYLAAFMHQGSKVTCIYCKLQQTHSVHS